MECWLLLLPSCSHTYTDMRLLHKGFAAVCTNVKAPRPAINSAPRRRVDPRRGSDSGPIKARPCVFSRPLPRRPALSPYFQPVWTPHPGLAAAWGGYAHEPAGVRCGTIRGRKREFCVSPLAASVFLRPWISSGWQEISLIWLRSSSCCSKYGKAGLVQVSQSQSQSWLISVKLHACVCSVLRVLTVKASSALPPANQQAPRC